MDNNNAFERAKAAYGTGAYDDATLEFLFPELKESEDERIRNDIRTVVREWWYKIGDCTPKFSTEDEMLAWLEKQKPGNKVESFADAFDTEFQKQVANIIASVLNKEHEYSKGYIEWIAQSLLGYAKNEIKPAEWSDEDDAKWYGVIETEEYMLRVVRGEQRFDVGNKEIERQCEEELDWLKSLRPQLKQELDKSDRMLIDEVIDLIEDGGLSRDEKDFYIERLKSLRLQPHWKPSEEQMKALNAAINFCASASSCYLNDAAYNILKGLCSDLKKL